MSAPVDVANLPGWPRGLGEELAAAYVGVSRSTWLREVDAGNAPAAVWITAGRRVWLREDLDAWLDSKAGRGGRSQRDRLLASLEDAPTHAA